MLKEINYLLKNNKFNKISLKFIIKIKFFNYLQIINLF